MRSPVSLGWCQEQGARQDHEDFQDSLDHQVHQVVRESQERPENQDQWVNPVTEDQMDHQESQD